MVENQQIDDLTIAWLAGLFEGEGNMSIAKNGGTRLTIRMTDRDVIEKVDAIFPSTKIQIVDQGPAHWKRQYAWRISQPDTVREILNLLLPWFGERRAAKAREVLNHLDNRPGNNHWGKITHCKQGHEFTPENTYYRPGTTHRRCRACIAGWARDYQERRKTPSRG